MFIKDQKGLPLTPLIILIGANKMYNRSTNIELYSFDCKAWQAFKTTTKMDLIVQLLPPGI